MKKKKISRHFIFDILTTAANGIMKGDSTPQQAASWLMNAVIDLQEADGGWKESDEQGDLE